MVYKRLGILKLDEVLPYIPLSKEDGLPFKKEYFGERVRMSSHRLKIFKEKGLICTACNLTATHFAVEKRLSEYTDKYHLNLYGLDENGNEILFTVDHVIPISKNGSNHKSNKVTMCQPCNVKKSNFIL